MSYSKQQLTGYAHEYLSGSNAVPIGALDDVFFRKECVRLWGPAPTVAEILREQQRNERLLDKLIKARSKLLGPRGGAPRSGQALRQFREIQFHINVLQGSL